VTSQPGGTLQWFIEHIFSCDFFEEMPQASPQPDLGQVGIEWRGAEELRTVRFYPRALLDALDRMDFGYRGVD
jgi:hypothetical protein